MSGLDSEIDSIFPRFVNFMPQQKVDKDDIVCQSFINRDFVIAPTSLFNVNTGELGAGSVGSRGKLFRLLRKEVQLIKIDPITEEPLRDEKGFCIKVKLRIHKELNIMILMVLLFRALMMSKVN